MLNIAELMTWATEQAVELQGTRDKSFKLRINGQYTGPVRNLSSDEPQSKGHQIFNPEAHLEQLKDDARNKVNQLAEKGCFPHSLEEAVTKFLIELIESGYPQLMTAERFYEMVLAPALEKSLRENNTAQDAAAISVYLADKAQYLADRAQTRSEELKNRADLTFQVRDKARDTKSFHEAFRKAQEISLKKQNLALGPDEVKLLDSEALENKNTLKLQLKRNIDIIHKAFKVAKAASEKAEAAKIEAQTAQEAATKALEIADARKITLQDILTISNCLTIDQIKSMLSIVGTFQPELQEKAMKEIRYVLPTSRKHPASNEEEDYMPLSKCLSMSTDDSGCFSAQPQSPESPNADADADAEMIGLFAEYTNGDSTSL